MPDDSFPVDDIVPAVVQLWDAIEYNDTNYTAEELIRRLRYAYGEAAKHFAQPGIVTALQYPIKNIEHSIRVATGYVVYCWVKVSLELMASLSIYFAYCVLVDDSAGGVGDPTLSMQDYVTDLLAGNPQRHPWFRLVNAHFPDLMKHFGPFCSLNIYCSTVDFFESCWIEQLNFNGYRGAVEYPNFLRRLNALGKASGASLWPTALFDEQKLLCEITTTIAIMEKFIGWVNDLLSFYKEFDVPRDRVGWVDNYCKVNDSTLSECLKQLSHNAIRVSTQLKSVFSDKDSDVADTVISFLHGYITWQFNDERYRFSEMCLRVKQEEEVSIRFHQYVDQAIQSGRVDPADWAVPTFTSLSVEKQNKIGRNITSKEGKE
ncbi:hypothetical protein XA68_13554 [Ophiocordyceps unilateralis]|uniref:Trichodiene synthase n=1 Tax=Ophiocordyceps unilateralis TaxID=268505 RepID=A0A2A9PBZ2_OPHUN|nr:hypothetical protein XA68_13554 [Ophiocordyceps unilateralis]